MLRGREAVIVDAVRTAIGRGHPKNGAFRAVHPNELLGSCFTARIDRSGLDPRLIGDVIAGCVTQHGEQALNIARNAPLSLEADADDELGTPWPQPLLDRYELLPQGISAELLAEQWKVSRHELHELSLRSHRLAGGLGTGTLIQAL